MKYQILIPLKELELSGEIADFWTRRGYTKDEPGACAGKDGSCQNQAERDVTSPRCDNFSIKRNHDYN